MLEAWCVQAMRKYMNEHYSSVVMMHMFWLICIGRAVPAPSCQNIKTSYAR